MSVLGFVKTQRLPSQLSGEDEVFQKELQSIKAKLSKGSQRIYRAGKAPIWSPAAAGVSSIVPPAASSSNATSIDHSAAGDSSLARALHHRMKADLHAASVSTHAGARRVAQATILTTGGGGREARSPHIDEPPELDADGDARMDDAMEEGGGDGSGDEGGRHGEGRRRRPIEAAILIAPTPSHATTDSAQDQTPAIKIDASQLEVPEPAEESDEEEQALARRRRARENAQRAREEEETRLAEEARKKEADEGEEGAEEEDEEEESEYDSDSDDERRRMMFKPIFRSKAERDTLAERDRLIAEEEAAAAAAADRKVERKKEAKLAVLDVLQKEVAAAAAKAAENADSDAEALGDELDEQLELDLWKLRELRRLKRDRDARKVFDAEEAETERRRHMTDAEIQRDNERLGLQRQPVGEKPTDDANSMKFMQRYYHKGGFFQDDESIAKLGDLATRDFHQATGQDRTVDRTALPQVMQVKKFAMKGQTKYTHLVDQDTTRRDENPWSKRNTLVGMATPTGAGDVVSDRQRKKHKS